MGMHGGLVPGVRHGDMSGTHRDVGMCLCVRLGEGRVVVPTCVIVHVRACGVFVCVCP